MKNKNETKSLLINMFTFGIGTFGSKLIMFLLIPLYTTYMNNIELGIGELVGNTMNLIFPIATLNIHSSLLRFTLDKSYDKKKVFQNTIIVIVSGFIITSYLIQKFNINSSVNDWKLHLCILLFTYSIRQAFSVFTKALGKTFIFTIDNIFYTACQLFFSIILLVVLNKKTDGYLEAMIYTNIISSIFLFFVSKLYQYFTIDFIDTKLIKKMTAFSAPLILNTISWWVTSFFDRFILEQYMGVNAVGIYSIASKMPALITAAASVFMQAWVLSAIKEYDNESNKSFFSNIFEQFSFIMLIISAFAIVLIKPFFLLFIGEDFVNSWIYVPFLILGASFSGLADFFGAIYNSAKKNVRIMFTTIIGATINIILNILLIPRIGIQGAVIATMISYFSIALYRLLGSRKFLKFNINFYKLGIGYIILFLECCSIIYIKNGIFIELLLLLILLAVYIRNIKLLVNTLYLILKRLVKKQKH